MPCPYEKSLFVRQSSVVKNYLPETMTSEPLKAIELFAGIGGFRLGMEAANIETIWANDINKLAYQVYQSNFGQNEIVFGDIRQINLSEIPDHDLLTAGFPCQPF
jgi:DNA (cytosine-5)-methyltransferase 1